MSIIRDNVRSRTDPGAVTDWNDYAVRATKGFNGTTGVGVAPDTNLSTLGVEPGSNLRPARIGAWIRRGVGKLAEKDVAGRARPPAGSLRCVRQGDRPRRRKRLPNRDNV